MISLKCLNTVCARSTIYAADVNKRAHKTLRKANMYIDHFILFNEDCAIVFSVLTFKQFVMCQKRLFSMVYWKTPCLSGVVRMDREGSRILSNAAHTQLTRKL